MAANQNSEITSTRPYLIRALHEWCCDNGFTPYITVSVDNSVQVPREYVKDDEIVLNIGFDATTALSMGNEYLEFKARFSGVVRDIMVPMDQVVAIFARENGQGMAFPKPDRSGQKMASLKPVPRPVISLAQGSDTSDASSLSVVAPTVPPKGTKPSLTRIK